MSPPSSPVRAGGLRIVQSRISIRGPSIRGSVAAIILLGAVAGSASLAQGEGGGVAPAVSGNRAPHSIAFSPDGSRAYVTEAAEGSVAVIDTATLAVEGHFATGERPAGVAVTPDGAEIVVANSFSGSVAVLNARTGARRALVPLPGMPTGVRIDPVGKRAFVSVSQLDEVAVLDLKTAAITSRLPTGRRPRALDLSRDGRTLVVANQAAGSLSLFDAASLKEIARVKLKGVNVRGVTVTADGTAAYATLMPPFNGRATEDPGEIWHNLVQSVTLDGADSRPGEDQWTDFARLPGSLDVLGSPDQEGIVLDSQAKNAWMAVGGRDVVTHITVNDFRRSAIWPFLLVETPVGANPRGLAMSPDGRRVWAANYLGNSVSVLDAGSGAVVRTIDLGKPRRVDPTLAGQYLFHNAKLTRTQRFTCASCHPDGASDGLAWSFAHVPDGVERRNSRDLRGGVRNTAPFRWSGLESHLGEFVQAEVTGLLGGPKPSAEQAAALAAAVEAFPLPPNPYRAPSGGFTELARRGAALFEGKAGCAACHKGPARGGTSLKAWVGTTRPSLALDVPHLTGVHDSPPYLHDGRAATLEEVFEKHNGAKKHGSAYVLTPEERAALLRYVREL